MKKDIILYLFILTAIAFSGYYIVQGYLISQERVNRHQCQEWKEELKVNDSFYLTDLQKQMCKELGEL